MQYQRNTRETPRQHIARIPRSSRSRPRAASYPPIDLRENLPELTGRLEAPLQGELVAAHDAHELLRLVVLLDVEDLCVTRQTPRPMCPDPDAPPTQLPLTAHRADATRCPNMRETPESATRASDLEAPEERRMQGGATKLPESCPKAAFPCGRGAHPARSEKIEICVRRELPEIGKLELSGST